MQRHIVKHFLSNLQPIGRAFALVQPASDRTALYPEPVKSTEEQVEVIKVGVARADRTGLCMMSRWCLTPPPPSFLLLQVYLEARKQEEQKHQQSLKMLSDEVSQIQEVSPRPVSAAAQRAASAALSGLCNHVHVCFHGNSSLLASKPVFPLLIKKILLIT